MKNKGFALTSLLFLIAIISFLLLKIHANTSSTIQNLQNIKFNSLNFNTNILYKTKNIPEKICHKKICILKYNKFKNYSYFFNLKESACKNLSENKRLETYFESETDCKLSFLYLNESSYYSHNIIIKKLIIENTISEITLINNGKVFIEELILNSNLNILANGKIEIERIVSDSSDLVISFNSINSSVSVKNLLGETPYFTCSKDKGNHFPANLRCLNATHFIKKIPNLVSAKLSL